MKLTENAKNYHDKMYPDYASTLAKTDPEFIERGDDHILFPVCTRRV